MLRRSCDTDEYLQVSRAELMTRFWGTPGRYLLKGMPFIEHMRHEYEHLLDGAIEEDEPIADKTAIAIANTHISDKLRDDESKKENLARKLTNVLKTIPDDVYALWAGKRFNNTTLFLFKRKTVCREVQNSPNASRYRSINLMDINILLLLWIYHILATYSCSDMHSLGKALNRSQAEGLLTQVVL